MHPGSIRTEWYYHYVLARIEQLKNAQPHSPEAEELQELTGLKEEYERRRDASGDNSVAPL